MKKHVFSKFLIFALIVSMLFSFVGCTQEDAELVADVLDIVEDVVTSEEEYATEPAPDTQQETIEEAVTETEKHFGF